MACASLPRESDSQCSPHQVSKAENEEAGTRANLPLDGLKQNTNRSAARVGSPTPGAGLSSTAQQQQWCAIRTQNSFSVHWQV